MPIGQIGTPGIEPETFGVQDRRSTTELCSYVGTCHERKHMPNSNKLTERRSPTITAALPSSMIFTIISNQAKWDNRSILNSRHQSFFVVVKYFHTEEVSDG